MATTKVGIITVSDTRSQELKADTTTGSVRSKLERAGYQVVDTALVADEIDQIKEHLIDMADRQQLGLIVTTGGTGLGPRDRTPEATRAVIDREAPGLPEAMRSQSAKANQLAWLSRSAAGLRGKTLIINLPGSPQGAVECLRIVTPLLPHALKMIQGHGHD